jgi:hypothetical protein
LNGATVPPGANNNAWIVNKCDSPIMVPAVANRPQSDGLGQWVPNIGKLTAPTAMATSME